MVAPVQYGGDEVSAIVLDIGSHSTKAGYAGEDCPKAVFPTSYSVTASAPSSTSTSTTADPRTPTYSHGNSVHLYRPHAIHANPISDGIITDWDALSRTLDHAFRDRMRLDTLADFPLLVTESSWNTREAREKMVEVAFEEWGTPAFYSVDKAVMSAFASAKGSALVIDVGDELTSVVPIYEGYVLRKAIQKQPAAGALISSILLYSLKATTDGIPSFPIVPHYMVKSKEAVDPNVDAAASLRHERQYNREDPNCPTTESYHHSQEMRVMHEFKETTCELLPSSWDDTRAQALAGRPFEFPDGYNSYFGVMRLSAPEVLFNPARFMPKELTTRPLPVSASTVPSHPYSALQPITRLIANSLMQIDQDLHSTLMSNIVVVGGTSLIHGFTDRLSAEIGAMSSQIKYKLIAPASAAERMHSSWLGGSILASLGTFHQLWIGADEYKEMGKSVIHRRAKN